MSLQREWQSWRKKLKKPPTPYQAFVAGWTLGEQGPTTAGLGDIGGAPVSIMEGINPAERDFEPAADLPNGKEGGDE